MLGDQADSPRMRDLRKRVRNAARYLKLGRCVAKLEERSPCSRRPCVPNARPSTSIACLSGRVDIAHRLVRPVAMPKRYEEHGGQCRRAVRNKPQEPAELFTRDSLIETHRSGRRYTSIGDADRVAVAGPGIHRSPERDRHERHAEGFTRSGGVDTDDRPAPHSELERRRSLRRGILIRRDGPSGGSWEPGLAGQTIGQARITHVSGTSPTQLSVLPMWQMHWTIVRRKLSCPQFRQRVRATARYSFGWWTGARRGFGREPDLRLSIALLSV